MLTIVSYLIYFNCIFSISTQLIVHFASSNLSKMASPRRAFFVLLCAYLSLNYANTATIEYEIVDKYLSITSSLVEAKSIDQFSVNVLKASKLFSEVLGGVLGMIDSILAEIETERRHQEIMNELRVIDSKLNVLSDNIKKRFDEVDLAISFDQIANQVTELNAVEDQYQEWLSYGNNLTTTRTERFRSSCLLNKVSSKPSFFRGLFTRNDDIRKPKENIIASRSRTKYFKFASSMVGYYLYSALLSGVCTGLQGNTTDVQITIQQDSVTYEKYLTEMSSVIEADHDQLGRNFWTNAIKDMDEFTEKYDGSGHETFAQAFHKRLTETYDYREWLVISYGDRYTNGPWMHEVYPSLGEQVYNNSVRSTYFYNAVRKFGRNLILASPSSIRPSPYPSQFSESAVKCFDSVKTGGDTYRSAIDSRVVVNQLKSCSLDSRFEPNIRFAFYTRGGYATVNNSPLAAAQEKRLYYGRSPDCGSGMGDTVPDCYASFVMALIA